VNCFWWHENDYLCSLEAGVMVDGQIEEFAKISPQGHYGEIYAMLLP
jgi:hypothetical protein